MYIRTWYAIYFVINKHIVNRDLIIVNDLITLDTALLWSKSCDILVI